MEIESNGSSNNDTGKFGAKTEKASDKQSSEKSNKVNFIFE